MKSLPDGTHNLQSLTHRVGGLLLYGLICIAIALLAACQPAAHTPASSKSPTPLAKFSTGQGQPLSARTPSTYPPFVIVQFNSSTTYEQAMAIVSDLGLHALYPCEGQGLLAGSPWASLDERWIYDLKPTANRLWVDGIANPSNQPYYKLSPLTRSPRQTG